ncbi:MAG: carboxymuconolactone decarboxylase family protein [Pseudomonadota bacterium]
MANNPAVLEIFLAIGKLMPQSGLSPMDREVICMEMARRNGCHYCVPAHRYVARQEEVDLQLIEQIAQGATLEGDDRPALIQRLTRRLVESTGKLDDEEFAAFQAHGVSQSDMIAVIGEIAHCTLTNSFNRLAETELDSFLEPYRQGPQD